MQQRKMCVGAGRQLFETLESGLYKDSSLMVTCTDLITAKPVSPRNWV